MFAIITACVLVLLAVVAVAQSWTIFHLQLRTRALGSTLSQLESATRSIASNVERSSNAKLRAEVDGLAAAVETLSATNRREFGKLWARVAPRESTEHRGNGMLPSDDLSELIALQQAPAVAPK